MCVLAVGNRPPGGERALQQTGRGPARLALEAGVRCADLTCRVDVTGSTAPHPAKSGGHPNP